MGKTQGMLRILFDEKNGDPREFARPNPVLYGANEGSRHEVFSGIPVRSRFC